MYVCIRNPVSTISLSHKDTKQKPNKNTSRIVQNVVSHNWLQNNASQSCVVKKKMMHHTEKIARTKQDITMTCCTYKTRVLFIYLTNRGHWQAILGGIQQSCSNASLGNK
jgi:hypothetical protein